MVHISLQRSGPWYYFTLLTIETSALFYDISMLELCDERQGLDEFSYTGIDGNQVRNLQVHQPTFLIEEYLKFIIIALSLRYIDFHGYPVDEAVDPGVVNV